MFTSTAENLRLLHGARDAIRAWVDSTRTANLQMMKAWRAGLLDELWNELRAEYPTQYLTYFVRARGMGDIKIGKSNQVAVRVRTLWTAAARGVDLVACYPADVTHETELHREFEHLRLCGEWFRPGAELMTHLQVIGCDTGAFTNAVPAHFHGRKPHLLPMGDVNTVRKYRNQED